VLKFVATGEPAELEQALTAKLIQCLADLKSHQVERSLCKVVDEVRAIWSAANACLVAGAPWSHIVKDPARAAVVRTSVNLLALAATVAWPFTPAAAERVLEALCNNAKPSWPSSAAQALTLIEGGRRVGVPPILFEKLSAGRDHRTKFAGSNQ
jgi:methionyl-tRNA synthetase